MAIDPILTVLSSARRKALTSNKSPNPTPRNLWSRAIHPSNVAGRFRYFGNWAVNSVGNFARVMVAAESV